MTAATPKTVLPDCDRGLALLGLRSTAVSDVADTLCRALSASRTFEAGGGTEAIVIIGAEKCGCAGYGGLEHRGVRGVGACVSTAIRGAATGFRIGEGHQRRARHERHGSAEIWES